MWMPSCNFYSKISVYRDERTNEYSQGNTMKIKTMIGMGMVAVLFSPIPILLLLISIGIIAFPVGDPVILVLDLDLDGPEAAISNIFPGRVVQQIRILCEL